VTLRAAAKPGAPLDLRSLFDRHYASVWRLLRRLGVMPAQLDDAAQEVFWVTARRLQDIQPGREQAFLYGVALRVAMNEQRRARAVPPFAPVGEAELADDAISPEGAVAQRELRALLDRVLAQLPLELRTVFVLYELEGLEIRQIAEIEAIPLGTASSRLRRAREAFSASAKRIRASLQARDGGLP
jgi:RNA polymerase sigma-70 factor, ECF subfamily